MITQRVITAIILAISCLTSFAQKNGQYFVSFTDKQNTPYSLTQPSAFLSQRSIERRAAQGIAYTNEDLPVNPAYVSTIQGFNGVIATHSSKWLNGVIISVSDSTQLTPIQALPFVSNLKYLSPEQVHFQSGSSALAGTESVPEWPLQPNLFKEQSRLMNLDVLYEAGNFGQGKLIAVLDAGFTSADTMRGFNALRAGRLLGSRDFVDPGSSAFNSSTHGTYVLSIMAGLTEDYMGTAPQASYYLIRTEKASSEYLLEEFLWMVGAELADSIGADIINSSLGYTDFDDSTQNHSYQMLNGNNAIVSIAADLAASRGILVVTSAGNQGASPWLRIGAPADADSVLAVGAVNNKGEYANFSSKGPRIDGMVKPEVATVGWQTEFLDLNSKVSKGNGTSFASPMLAGAAACLWQSYPSASAAEVRDAVIRSADRFHNPDSLTGYGIPDFAIASQILQGREIPSLGAENLLVFPNPFESRIVVMFSADDNGSCRIALYDRIGREVYRSEDIEYQQGYNSFQIKGLDHLASGVYLVSVKGDDFGKVNRVIK
jgi:serine protease AprX